MPAEDGQRTISVIPDRVGPVGHNNGSPAPRPMTSKQARKEYLKRTRGPALTWVEQRRLQAEIRDDIKQKENEEKKEREKERARARAEALREKHKGKKDAENAAKRKAGVPLKPPRPSQGTIASFVRGGGIKRKREVIDEDVETTSSAGSEVRPDVKPSKIDLDRPAGSDVKIKASEGDVPRPKTSSQRNKPTEAPQQDQTAVSAVQDGAQKAPLPPTVGQPTCQTSNDINSKPEMCPPPIPARPTRRKRKQPFLMPGQAPPRPKPKTSPKVTAIQRDMPPTASPARKFRSPRHSQGRTFDVATGSQRFLKSPRVEGQRSQGSQPRGSTQRPATQKSPLSSKAEGSKVGETNAKGSQGRTSVVPPCEPQAQPSPADATVQTSPCADLSGKPATQTVLQSSKGEGIAADSFQRVGPAAPDHKSQVQPAPASNTLDPSSCADVLFDGLEDLFPSGTQLERELSEPTESAITKQNITKIPSHPLPVVVEEDFPFFSTQDCSFSAEDLADIETPSRPSRVPQRIGTRGTEAATPVLQARPRLTEVPVPNIPKMPPPKSPVISARGQDRKRPQVTQKLARNSTLLRREAPTSQNRVMPTISEISTTRKPLAPCPPQPRKSPRTVTPSVSSDDLRALFSVDWGDEVELDFDFTPPPAKKERRLPEEEKENIPIQSVTKNLQPPRGVRDNAPPVYARPDPSPCFMSTQDMTVLHSFDWSSQLD